MTTAATTMMDSTSLSSSSLPVAAIAQLRSTSNKFDNLLDVAKCCGMAQRCGASMLFLPECFAFIGTSADETLRNAEPYEYLESHTLERGQAHKQQSLNSDSVNAGLMHAFRAGGGIISSDGCSTGINDGTLPSPDDDEENSASIEVRSVIAALATLARTSGLWISAGGLHVKGDAPSDPATGRQRVYNTHLVLDSNGSIKARYDKRHLFDVSIPSDGIELRESKSTAPGRHESVVCESPVGNLGLSICYDLRFPEHYAKLVQGLSDDDHDDSSSDAGAQILLVPSAFTVPTGAAHWHILLQGTSMRSLSPRHSVFMDCFSNSRLLFNRHQHLIFVLTLLNSRHNIFALKPARAIENQCYVFAAAQYGIHNEKRKSFGHAVAIDPWGTVIADAGGYPRLQAVAVGGTASAVDGNTNVNDGDESSIEVPSIVTCKVDLGSVETTRQRMPLQLHRKTAKDTASQQCST
jgi:predicted amidohydrolase